MTNFCQMADRIDPRGSFRAYDIPHADLIAASDALRQHATALEIGRGIGREEAAKVVDEAAERCLANAEHQRQHGDRKVAEQWGMKASLLFDRASAIRAASQALDVEEMVMLAIKADMARQLSGKPLPGPQHDSTDWSAEGDFQSLDLTEIARAVIASLGIKNG